MLETFFAKNMKIKYLDCTINMQSSMIDHPCMQYRLIELDQGGYKKDPEGERVKMEKVLELASFLV